MMQGNSNPHQELPAKIRVRIAIAMILLSSAAVTIFTYLAA